MLMLMLMLMLMFQFLSIENVEEGADLFPEFSVRFHEVVDEREIDDWGVVFDHGCLMSVFLHRRFYTGYFKRVEDDISLRAS